MAVINDTGITPKTLEEYLTGLRAVWRSAFGEDLNVDVSTPQGQVIGVEALNLSLADDALVRIAQATNIYRAAGQQIDGLAAILSILRRAASRSSVTATLTGVSATVIPAGTRARTTGGDLFALDSPVQIGGGGSVNATMFSVETGPIPIGAGELTQVVDVVPGWETINNVAAGQLGQNEENDAPYRSRYFRELFKNSQAPLESLISRIAEVENVTDVIGVENDTSTPVVIQNIEVAAHSVALVVDGGNDADIAEAIRMGKTGGTGTVGTTEVTIQPNGFNQTYRFFRVREVPIEVDITIRIRSGFPGNGIALIKERVAEYISGPFGVEEEGYFETDGMSIAEDLEKARLYTPLNSVPGYTLTAFVLNIKGGATDVDLIETDLDQRVTVESLDDITITVVT